MGVIVEDGKAHAPLPLVSILARGYWKQATGKIDKSGILKAAEGAVRAGAATS